MPPKSKLKSNLKLLSKSKSSAQTHKKKKHKKRVTLNCYLHLFKACLQGGWIEFVPKVDKTFTIMFQNEFKSKYFSQPYVDTITGMENKIVKENILHHLLDPNLPTISEHITKKIIYYTIVLVILRTKFGI